MKRKTKAELLQKRAEILDKAQQLHDAHEEFTKAQEEEFDLLMLEVEEIDAQIKRIDRMATYAASGAAAAAPAAPESSETPEPQRSAPGQEGTPAGERSDPVVRASIARMPSDRKDYGLRFAQLVRAMAATKGDRRQAVEWAQRAFGRDHDVTKALEWGSAPGNELVPTDWANEVIELLRNMTVVRRMGPRSMGMPMGNMTLPFQDGSATGAYVGENTAVNATDASFDNFTMSAKKLMAVTSITNELLRYNAYGVDALVRDDLVEVMALTEDSQLLRGTGSATAPTSLLEIATSNSAVYTSAPTAPLAPTIAEVDSETGQLMLHLKEANIVLRSCYWVMAPRVAQYLSQLRDGNGNKAYPTIDSNGTFRGWPIIESNQVPINLGTGTDESEIYFVSGPQLILADTRRMDVLTTDTGSYQVTGSLVSTFANDVTAIRVISEHDFNARHNDAIAVLDTVRWGA